MSQLPMASTARSTQDDQRESESARADRIERNVDRIIAALAEPTPSETSAATATIQALVTQHGLQFEEWDITLLDEQYRDKFFALYIETRDDKVIVVPSGQDPAHRLAALRAVLAHLGVAA